MGKIRDRLKSVAYMMGLANEKEAVSNQLDWAGEAIESELDDLVERFDKELREQYRQIQGLKKDIVDLVEMLAQRTKRIEELEDRLYGIEQKQFDYKSRIEALESKCGDIGWFMGQVKSNLRSIEAMEKQVKHVLFGTTPFVKDVPTDKDGKPPGGLEPGDVITAIDEDHGTHHIGLFHHAEESKRGSGGLIFAYWKRIGDPMFHITPAWRPQRTITFEFRPKPKES